MGLSKEKQLNPELIPGNVFLAPSLDPFLSQFRAKSNGFGTNYASFWFQLQNCSPKRIPLRTVLLDLEPKQKIVLFKIRLTLSETEFKMDLE